MCSGYGNPLSVLPQVILVLDDLAVSCHELELLEITATETQGDLRTLRDKRKLRKLAVRGASACARRCHSS